MEWDCPFESNPAGQWRTSSWGMTGPRTWTGHSPYLSTSSGANKLYTCDAMARPMHTFGQQVLARG